MHQRFRQQLTSGLVLASVLLLLPQALGQDANLAWPISAIEQKLASAEFEILEAKGSRWEKDRTQRVTLRLGDGSEMKVKWAAAPKAGGALNNRPRYEVAAYEFQKLFLDERDYVVPPTALRVFSPEIQTQVAKAPATFRKSDSIVVVLQYWLQNVNNAGVFDLDRFDVDSTYRRRLATLNLFTHLVWHNDSNKGNYLISQDVDDPRLWAVDNGFAFGVMDESNRGFEWRDLRVDRLPRDIVDRLRTVDLALLTDRLGVLAQFEIRDRKVTNVPPGENLSPRSGIRRGKNVVQMGLTLKEIGDINRRLRKLLRRIDAGEIVTF